MEKNNTNIKMFAGAILMILLQIFLAPIISINSVIPNFLLAFTIVCVCVRPDQNHLVYAFVMGLLYDFITSGPVGSMALIMAIMAFVSALALRHIPSANFIITILVIFASILICNIIYGIFQISIFIDANFMDLVTYRILPCSIYDIILAVIILPIIAKIIAPPVNRTNSSYNINNRR